MLPCKSPAIFLSLVVLLTSLTGCANSPVAKNLEESLAADSRLKDNPVTFGATNNREQQAQQNEPKAQLPADFPQDIPQYPNATLQEVTPSTNGESGSVSTRWLSSDPSNIIESFYRQQLQTNNWQIEQQPQDDTGSILQARRNDLLLKVSTQPKSVTNASPNQPQTSTELLIEYTRNSTATAQPTPTPNTEAANTPIPNATVAQPGEPQFIGPVPPTNTTAQPSPQPSATPEAQNTTTNSPAPEFTDLKGTPQQVRQYIQDLAALGVVPVKSNASKSNSTATTQQFEPGKNITRREYARWLVTANNAMYANNPAKQIRLASETSQPAFADVSKTHPEFSVIQGLAEAGLIPSPLSGDSTAVSFRPDAPLTREQLMLWKVPLDTRRALPTANLDAVKQTWGFQDVGQIDAKALRAVLADFQNGEQSNIRRVFGYTTLFQPKKPVTRAETAATLWYFGTQGEGVSAADALKIKNSQGQ